jgi:hypothetical protein
MSDSDDNANNLPDGQMENGHVPMEVEPNNSAERQSGSARSHDQFDIDLPTSHRVSVSFTEIFFYCKVSVLGKIR